MEREILVWGALKTMTKPLDKILCERKFYRYVVACMHNCPQARFCKEFWRFFEAKGLTPAEYFNENGIGDMAMRRVVFDCDRCGRKDIPEIFGMYNSEGETEEHRLNDSQKAETTFRTGYTDADLTRISFVILEQLEHSREWQHYCRKCFRVVVDSVAKMLSMGQRRPRPQKKPEAELVDAPEVDEMSGEPEAQDEAPAVVEANVVEVRPAAARKVAVKSTAPKPAVAKPAAKKPAAKPAAKKPAAKKPAAKKPAVKPAAKKPAAKKPAPEPKAGKSRGKAEKATGKPTRKGGEKGQKRTSVKATAGALLLAR